MCSLLGRHSIRLVFVLLCVVVLTRLPPVGLAEDAWSSSLKVDDAVAFVGDVPGHSIDVNVASATIVFPLAALTGRFVSTLHPAEYSILRL
jgi:hypothetical protein